MTRSTSSTNAPGKEVQIAAALRILTCTQTSSVERKLSRWVSAVPALLGISATALMTEVQPCNNCDNTEGVFGKVRGPHNHTRESVLPSMRKTAPVWGVVFHTEKCGKR
ncbi:putative ATP-dependent DEAD/H RNA helicase [Trypanosoma cruzi]|nr:putative ATP-dependent DEAD/H RNA helicase [Trypanosoma cruzi]